MPELTDEQERFLNVHGKVVLCACPGSGKTYIVARKLISYLNKWDNKHQGIAVLSFTNVASKEVETQFKELFGQQTKIGYPHFIGTVDSFLNTYIGLQYSYLFSKIKKRMQLALNNKWGFTFGYWYRECREKGCPNHAEDFYYGIDNCLYRKKEKVICERHGKAKLLPCQQFKKILRNANVIFQNEIPGLCHKLLKKYPKIAEAIALRFPVIIIDEMQDTSLEQMAIFDLLFESGVKEAFLVGDPDQSIYEWRNATSKCFIDKMQDTSWENMQLTGNFRSSQNICNATRYFSSILSDKEPSDAIGEYKDEEQKPILLITDEEIKQDRIYKYFFDKCSEMEIDLSPGNVAILTRSRVYPETDIHGLWKSAEVEMLASAIYEWNNASRKKAVSICSEAMFSLIFGKFPEETEMKSIISKSIGIYNWNEFIVDLLVGSPNMELNLGIWIKDLKVYIINSMKNAGLRLHSDKDIESIIKIKRNDKNSRNFKQIQTIRFFEKGNMRNYTRSSVHGVKGESFDAVLLHVNNKSGNTLTPSFLNTGDISSELMRIAYVAMTRARRLLIVAVPKAKRKREYVRFPNDLWEYEYLINN